VGLLAIGLFALLEPSTIDPYVMDVRAMEDQPWRLLTACLLHAGQLRSPDFAVGLMHLGFNLYWLWTLGAVIEEGFGHLRTAILVVLSAVAGSALEYGFAGSAVGLSGVVYGLAGFAWILERRVPKYGGIMDPGRLRILLGWLVLCIGLTIGGVLPVANFAHVGGLVVGVLMALGTLEGGAKGAAWLSAAAGVLLAGLVSASVLRPTLNFSRRAGADTFELGSRAFDAGDYATAAKRFRQSTRFHRTYPEAWANLAMSLERLGDEAGAETAWAEVARRAPDDPRWSELLHERASEPREPGEPDSATTEDRAQ
jgi:membrane associated rhomboid family serine protease